MKKRRDNPMIRPYQKAANDKNIERVYDAMIAECTKQRTFIERNNKVPHHIVRRIRTEYAKNIKAVIEAKYALSVALVKPVSPCGSDVMSDSTKFIVDRLLSGEFKFVVTKTTDRPPNKDYVTYTTSVVATDKSIPLTITMERCITRKISNDLHVARARSKSFKLDTSIPGLLTEREAEYINSNYYDAIYGTAKSIQEEADRAKEKAVAVGAIKEVTKLYKEAGIEIPK